MKTRKLIRDQPRPVCRAMSCVFNEHDTCMKHAAGREPGYQCPDFLARKEDTVRNRIHKNLVESVQL